MCAIVDANVVSEVFGTNPPEAGMEFLLWIERNVNGRLVVGGKLLDELYNSSPGFREWASEVQRSGNMRRIKKEQIDVQEEKLREASEYVSDDPHIIALAQVSGARLLYSNDKKLQQDFNNKELIDNPRGKVYTTNHGREAFSDSHKGLLAKKDLCQANT